MASTVRKCIEKKTTKAYAVKVVDITCEHQSEKDARTLYSETKAEVELLRDLQECAEISKCTFRSQFGQIGLSETLSASQRDG